MESLPIREILSKALLAEEAYLLNADHPAIIAAHRAAICDFEKRLCELHDNHGPFLPG